MKRDVGAPRLEPFKGDSFTMEVSKGSQSTSSFSVHVSKIGENNWDLIANAKDPLESDDISQLFVSATDMIEEYYRVKRRQNPPYRTIEDQREEQRTGKSTGCFRCRLLALDISEGTDHAQQIYKSIVEACPHIVIKKKEARSL